VGSTDVPLISEPVMILRGLKEGKYIAKAEYVQELCDLVTPSTSLVKDKVRMKVVIGASGVGKSRLDYEAHTKVGGLYFTTSTQGNGGSDDFSQMMTGRRTALEKQNISLIVKNSALYTSDRPNAAIYDRNVALIGRELKRLISIRMLVKERVNTRLRRGLSNYEWLLLQIYPTYFFGCDLFSFLYLSSLPDSDAPIPQQLISFDEAHVLLEKASDGEFISRKVLDGLQISGSDAQSVYRIRNLLTGLCEAFSYLGLQAVVLLGTGEKMRDCLEIINPPLDKNLFTVLDQWDYLLNPDTAWKTVGEGIIKPDDKPKFFQKFPLFAGRPRLVANFARRYLQYQENFTAALNGIWNLSKSREPKSLFSIYNETLKQRGMKGIEKAFEDYYQQGLPFQLQENEKLTLQKEGFLALFQPGSTILKETLVFETMLHHFKESWIPAALKSMQGNRSGKGDNFEDLCGLLMAQWIQKGTTLAELLNLSKDSSPSYALEPLSFLLPKFLTQPTNELELKEDFVSFYEQILPLKASVSSEEICDYFSLFKEGVEFTPYLNHIPKSEIPALMIKPANAVGPDIIMILITKTGTRIVLLIQFKIQPSSTEPYISIFTDAYLKTTLFSGKEDTPAAKNWKAALAAMGCDPTTPIVRLIIAIQNHTWFYPRYHYSTYQMSPEEQLKFWGVELASDVSPAQNLVVGMDAFGLSFAPWFQKQTNQQEWGTIAIIRDQIKDFLNKNKKPDNIPVPIELEKAWEEAVTEHDIQQFEQALELERQAIEHIVNKDLIERLHEINQYRLKVHQIKKNKKRETKEEGEASSKRQKIDNQVVDNQ